MKTEMTVYKATNLTNNKKYFGVTSRGLRYAIWNHRGRTKLKERRLKLKPTAHKVKTPFHRALIKYGEYRFIYSVVDTFLSKDAAYAFKEALIQLYCTTNPQYGYNCTTGGLRTYKMTPETKNRMSIVATGKKMPASFVRLMKERIGILHPSFGYKHSKESRENMRQGQLNSDYVITDEHKRKTSDTMKKRWENPTEKMLNDSYNKTHQIGSRDIRGKKNPMYGKGMKGENNPMYGRTGELNPNYGKPISAERKQKMKEGRERYQAERRRMALEKNKTLTEKKCIHCKEVKPLNMFHKSKKLLDGHAGHCKICDRARKK